MAWNRSATLLSVLVFLAFGFQVVGVFSDPVSRNKLPIATVNNFDYGILGWCPHATSKNCSAYGIGYTLQDDKNSSWSQSTQKTLSQIMIVHIVAAGLLLISLLMTLGTHWQNVRYWSVVEAVLSISFVAAALSFAVEVALFRTNLKFSGWFTLASTVLSLISVIALGIAQKSLHASLGRTRVDGKDALFGNDPITFENSGGFIVGRDDEKLLKQPAVGLNQVNSSTSGFDIPKFPSFRNNGSQKGYGKIPDPAKTTQRTYPGGAPGSGQSRTHPLPLPVSGSSESVGAVPRSQQQGSRQRAPIGAGKPNAASYGSGPRPTGTGPGAGAKNVPGAAGPGSYAAGSGASAGTGAMGAAAAAGAATGAVAANAAGRGNQSRTQRQDTWSQQVLQKAQQPNQQRPVHASNTSIASTQAARIPAGSYLNGVNETERYGPNVVQIPKVRTTDVRQAESATIEYHKDETQSKSPLSKSKVPNYSRMSVQDKLGASKGVSPMLERYVTSTDMNTESRDAQEPFYDAPNSRISTQSPDSEASHYTSLSERHQRDVQKKPNQPNATGQASTAQTDYQGTSGYNGYYQGYQGQNATQPQYQNYNYAQPTYQGAYQPGYQGAYQQGYQGYQGYAQGYQGYGYQPGYQPGYSAPGYGGYGYAAGSSPRRPRPQQRSEIALQSNPDFSVGDLGKKKRPGRR